MLFYMLIEKIKKLKQTEETLEDLFSLMLQLEDLQRQKELNKWIRSHARQITTARAYDLVHKTYIFGGRYSFDDYMIACEWNREPQVFSCAPRFISFLYFGFLISTRQPWSSLRWKCSTLNLQAAIVSTKRLTSFNGRKLRAGSSISPR